MANVDTNEEFWGITLTGDRKVHTWNPAEAEEDVEHKIQVTQACLGQKAKEGERNVIEVTTEDEDGKKISCAIVSLRVGFAECMHLELGFTNPVKFMLKEGNGPISLCGIHLSALPLDLDNDEMESSDDGDEEEVPQLVKGGNSKAKIEESSDDKIDDKKVETAQAEIKESLPAVAAVVEKKEVESTSTKKRVLQKEEEKEEVSPKKKKEEPMKEESRKEEKKVESKKEEDEDGDNDEEEDDDDDEEDEEDDMDDIDMDALDEEDMEGLDSEDMDSDDDDDDEDDEEEDDEEEESEEETPKLKKKPPPKVNGIPPKKSNTPASKPAQQSKPLANKENVNTKIATPKANSKDTPKAPTPKRTPEELKTFLLKSPNLPKKYEKFSNFLKNNMKVTDAKSQKELWEYVQKNKK